MHFSSYIPFAVGYTALTLVVLASSTLAQTTTYESLYTSSDCSGTPKLMVAISNSSSNHIAGTSVGNCTVINSGLPEKFIKGTTSDGIEKTVSNAFGSTPYMAIQNFSDSNCADIYMEVAINPDGSCVPMDANGSYMFSLQGDTLTGAYYTDKKCEDGMSSGIFPTSSSSFNTCFKMPEEGSSLASSGSTSPIKSGMMKIYRGGQTLNSNSINFVSADAAKSNSEGSSKTRSASSLALVLTLVAATILNIF